MQHNRDKPVLMIGLDAAEITLVQQWMDDGRMPNLRALRDRGSFGSLRSTADWLVGSPWPTFYTGTPPQDHGFYHYLIWRPETMRTERPHPDWLPMRPFWRTLDGAGKRAVVLDVPLCYAPEPFGGVEICGWATHEALMPAASYPADRLAWANAAAGIPPLGHEEARSLTGPESLQVRDDWLRITRLVGDLSVRLMREETWDLFLVCFTAPHRAGHQFWDETSIVDGASEEERRQHRHALRDLYEACDAEVGRLLAAAEDANVLVFSLHGMGSNQSRSEILQDMLARVLADDDRQAATSSQTGLLGRMRERLPVRWRNWVKNRLPVAVQDRLTVFWRSRGIDWRKTRAFSVFSDLDGYVRINLRGREPQGIVAPGADCDALCKRIAEGLLTFVDERSGEAVVDRVGRREDLFPDGARARHLPDLIVRWSPTSAASHRRIVSPRFGAVDWPTPGHHPQGRSGNHRGNGFLFAAGAGIAAGATIENGHILDLAPTACALLGLDVPAQMKGRPLFNVTEANR